MGVLLPTDDDKALELDVAGKGNVDEQLGIRVRLDPILLVQSALVGLEDLLGGVLLRLVEAGQLGQVNSLCRSQG